MTTMPPDLPRPCGATTSHPPHPPCPGLDTEQVGAAVRRRPPTPPRPTWDQNAETPQIPEGWSEVVVGEDGQVIAGWTTAGNFYAYVSTESIVRTCMDVIREAHRG